MNKSTLNPALEVKCLCHSFGTQQVLQNVSFSVAAGEVVAIKGPSGSGKSTLLHLLGGLDTPQSGEIWLQGVRTDCLHTQARSRLRAGQVGLVFQHHYLLEDLSLLENILVPMLLAEKPDQARARELLQAIGLEHRAHEQPGVLSGGERQRVAIARALASSSTVLLADEPTGSLDRGNAKIVTDLMLSLAKKQNAGVVLVTHDDELAAQSDRTLFLLDGVLQP